MAKAKKPATPGKETPAPKAGKATPAAKPKSLPAEAAVEFRGEDIGIDPNVGYNLKTLLNNAQTYFTAYESLNALTQNSGDYRAKRGLAGIFSPRHPEQILKADSGSVVESLSPTISNAGVSLAQYASNNKLETKLKADQLNTGLLILGNPENLRLYNTSDKDKTLIEIIKRQSAVKQGKMEYLRSDLPELVAGLTDWQAALFTLNQDDPRYMNSFLSSYAGYINGRYEQAFTTTTGKKTAYDTGKMSGFIGRSFAAVRSEMAKEKDKDKKAAIFAEKAAPAYLDLVKILMAS